MRVLAEELTKEIKIEDEIVTIKKRSGADDLEISKVLKEDASEIGMKIIGISIVKWTFKDKDGKLLPITRDIFLKLRADILNKIISEITAFNTLDNEEIKN
uniref:Uncharacterized protein n=1 Tax=viral metagenome TaxID=1070528 RepID=A0A6M3IT14_9ZZZZ